MGGDFSREIGVGRTFEEASLNSAQLIANLDHQVVYPFREDLKLMYVKGIGLYTFRELLDSFRDPNIIKLEPVWIREDPVGDPGGVPGGEGKILESVVDCNWRPYPNEVIL